MGIIVFICPEFMFTRVLFSEPLGLAQHVSWVNLASVDRWANFSIIRFPSSLNEDKILPTIRDPKFDQWTGRSSNRGSHALKPQEGRMSQKEALELVFQKLHGTSHEIEVFDQWEFQDPKMGVLYHIRPYFGDISPYIALT